MGNLFGGSPKPEINIDFDNVKPGNEEVKVFNDVDSCLRMRPEVLRKIEEYKGCQDLARKAMSDPTYDNEREAFEGLLYAVDSISAFFEFAKLLEKTVPPLLLQLAPASVHDVSKIQEQQALTHQLAQILDFSLQFDQTRMMRPHLSNDFSYYRRLLPKFNKHPDVRVKDDEASGMALFTAEHIPMMACLSKSTQRAMDKNDAVAIALATLANSCLKSIKTKKGSADTNLFLARAMTGTIVLYDHVHPLGAFHKKSPINMRQCILLLKNNFPQEVSLMNAIRFSSKHYKDAPASIQDLFD